MSFENTRVPAAASTGRLRRLGGTAAALAAGSGLMLGFAAPAHAGAVSSDSYSYNTPAFAPAAPVQTPAAGTHVVQPGDTLGRIAATYGVSLDSILSLNGLGYGSVIYVGDVIAFGGAAPAAPLVSLAAPAAPAASVTTLASAVTPVATDTSSLSAANQAILASAYAQLGAVQDCTVLGEVALRAAGVQGVGDESPASLMAFATPVSDPQPGDFVYYADGGLGFAHNAVYIGNGRAIHSGWNGSQTVIESVNVGSGPVFYRVMV